MLNSKLTMSQIAEELGVTRSTVSAVINGREKKQRISEATVVRVREYLNQRGYVQSRSAMQMKNGGKADHIGILYCGNFMEFPHQTEALSYLSRELEESSGVVEITGVTPEKLHNGLKDQVAKGVRKLIWLHTHSSMAEQKELDSIAPLIKQMDKVVIYDGGTNIKLNNLTENIRVVGFNREKSYRQLAELWHKAGFHKVALSEMFYNSKQGFSSIQREIFSEAGFEVFGLHPADRSGLSDDIAAAILAENLIKLHRDRQVNCAFIRNEMQAALVLHHLATAGVKVPEDIAVVGFGFNPYLKMLPVPLTTFSLPVKSMCDKVVSLLNDDNYAKTPKLILFDNELIIGKSHDPYDKL